MTSRVFLDRVQATPDKKDQLAKESASSPCPERTIKLSGKPIPQEVLDDLCARFLLNIPESGTSDKRFSHSNIHRFKNILGISFSDILRKG